MDLNSPCPSPREKKKMFPLFDFQKDGQFCRMLSLPVQPFSLSVVCSGALGGTTILSFLSPSLVNVYLSFILKKKDTEKGVLGLVLLCAKMKPVWVETVWKRCRELGLNHANHMVLKTTSRATCFSPMPIGFPWEAGRWRYREALCFLLWRYLLSP